MKYRIQTFNKISPLGLERFPKDHYDISDAHTEPHAIILRSHNLEADAVPRSVLAVARAGAGVNNVPVDALTQRGVPVFNTPGANANAVKELVLTGMLLSARHICNAWAYTQTLSGDDKAFKEAVENGKKQFQGFELPGKTLGIIGLGAIGVKVANAALALGMRVIGYDPAITVQRAWELSSDVEHAMHLDDLLKTSDFVTVHVPLMDTTRELINAKRLQSMKPSAVLLNFARGEIISEADVIKALASQKLAAYVCDFPSPALKGLDKVITLPHLGASTVEAEDNCAVMAADELREYLENGHIRNAVNFPNVELPRQGKTRLCIANSNVPNMVGQISSVLGHAKLNIVEMVNKSRNNIAYTLIDLDNTVDDALIASLSDIQGVLAIRVIT